MITGVVVAGVTLDPNIVSTEAITVLHGRGAVDDGPSPGSATVTLLTKTMPTWSVGDPIVITSSWGPLFTGEISDRRIPEHIQTVERGLCARVELDAAGRVATLGRRPVGDEPWPQETATARAERVLTLAGVPHSVAAPEPPATAVEVNPQDVDVRTALDVITDLASDTAAAVVDTPDGRVLFQPLGARQRQVFFTRWEDFTTAATWSQFPSGDMWSDFDTLSPAAQTLVLPSSAVGFEPEWRSSAAAVVNSVRVGYGVPAEGAQQDSISGTDDLSIGRYGKRHYGNDSQLARLEDAQAAVSRVLSTRAWERWALGSVDVYADALDDPTKAALAGLLCGDWVQVNDLPQPAPAASWAGICEGWAYREWVAGDTRHAAWTLSLSDPQLSLAVPIWGDYTATFMWSEHSAQRTWLDMTSIDALTGA